MKQEKLVSAWSAIYNPHEATYGVRRALSFTSPLPAPPPAERHKRKAEMPHPLVISDDDGSDVAMAPSREVEPPRRWQARRQKPKVDIKCKEPFFELDGPLRPLTNADYPVARWYN